MATKLIIDKCKKIKITIKIKKRSPHLGIEPILPQTGGNTYRLTRTYQNRDKNLNLVLICFA